MSRSDFVVWVWLDKHTLTPLYPSLNIVWRDMGRTWLEHSAYMADQYFLSAFTLITRRDESTDACVRAAEEVIEAFPNAGDERKQAPLSVE